MKVKLIFLNSKGLIERQIDTTKVENQKAYYKINRFPASLFEKEKEIAIDLNLCLFDLKRKQYLAFFKDNKQITFNEIQNLDLKDYLNNFKIAQLTKELSLQKPEGFEKYLPYITMVTILIMVLFAYYMIKDVVNSLNARFDYLNKSIQIMQKDQQIFLNVTKEFNKYLSTGRP